MTGVTGGISSGPSPRHGAKKACASRFQPDRTCTASGKQAEATHVQPHQRAEEPATALVGSSFMAKKPQRLPRTTPASTAVGVFSIRLLSDVSIPTVVCAASRVDVDARK